MLTYIKYIVFAMCAALWGYSLTEPLYTPTALPVGKDHYIFPNVIAHKGLVSQTFPGNSLSAIQEAFSSTVDGIEVDIKCSKDGVLFLYHGDTLEEYTNHHGTPEHFTWAHLSHITYKNSQEKLMKLDDFFNIVGSQKFIFLDVKSRKILDKMIGHRLVDCIKRHGLERNVFVESFNPILLTLIRLYDRDIMLMYTFTDNATAIGEESQAQFDKIPWILKQYWMQKQIRRVVRPDVLGPRFNFNDKLLKKLVAHGYPVISWTVDDAKTAKNLYALGVKGLQSNRPGAIEQVAMQRCKKIQDAGGSVEAVHTVITVRNIQDVREAIDKAKRKGKTISIGGRRHSMGGHTLYKGSIFLDMLHFDRVTYHPSTQTVTAQAGATWKKIQEVLVRHDRSVKVMQSDNIFTVGGSISANVHGWQVGAPPIGSTIQKMTVMTADGNVHDISPTVNAELFKAIMGGYGMFGVILEAELQTVPNTLVKFNAQFTHAKNLETYFEKYVTHNPKAELAYARFSTNQHNLLEKVGIFWYETKGPHANTRSITPENLVAFKRSLFRLSQYSDLGKKLRWTSEKAYAEFLSRKNILLSRSDAMNTDVHILWPLYGHSKDILHEYFVPKGYVHKFITKLKSEVQKHGMNLLNVTLRTVKKDTISQLPYAKTDMYGLVCLFSQKQTPDDERKMKDFTQRMIEHALSCNGTFYLPYRLHYEKSHLLSAYPEIKTWVSLKKKYDADGTFNSQFFSHIQKILKND